MYAKELNPSTIRPFPTVPDLSVDSASLAITPTVTTNSTVSGTGNQVGFFTGTSVHSEFTFQLPGGMDQYLIDRVVLRGAMRSDAYDAIPTQWRLLDTAEPVSNPAPAAAAPFKFFTRTTEHPEAHQLANYWVEREFDITEQVLLAQEQGMLASGTVVLRWEPISSPPNSETKLHWVGGPPHDATGVTPVNSPLRMELALRNKGPEGRTITFTNSGEGFRGIGTNPDIDWSHDDGEFGATIPSLAANVHRAYPYLDAVSMYLPISLTSLTSTDELGVQLEYQSLVNSNKSHFGSGEDVTPPAVRISIVKDSTVFSTEVLSPPNTPNGTSWVTAGAGMALPAGETDFDLWIQAIRHPIGSYDSQGTIRIRTINLL